MIDRDGPVDPLDPGLGVAERRDELAVAQRPIGAAEPGIGGAHDDPDRDQPESGREGERGELLEAVHEAPILPRRRLPAARDTLSAMTPRRLAPAPGRCSPWSPPRAASSGAVRGAVRADAWGPPATPPKLTPVLVTNAIAKGKARILFLYLDSQNAVASAPDRTAKVAFYDLATDPAKPVATVDGEFVWTIENERGMYVVNADFPTAGTWGAEFTTAGRRARRPRPSASPSTSANRRRPSRSARRRRHRRRRLPPTSAATSRRSRPTRSPDPAFYQTSVADALAAHKPFMLVFATPKFCTSAAMRPDARPVQADRQGQPGRHVHQRRAVQAQGHRRHAPAGPRRERPAPGDRHHRTSGASCPSRGSSRSIATASSRARTR